MTAATHDPGRGGFLDEKHVTTADAFNREMQYRGSPYRMEQLKGRRPDRGHWVLYEIRDDESLYQVPCMDEGYAVQIMRAWIYGMMHQQSIQLVGQAMRGELDDY